MRTVRTLMAALAMATAIQTMAQKDSIFIYSPNERQGLHAAVLDSTGWQHLGQLCSSDYGTCVILGYAVPRTAHGASCFR